MSVVPQIFNLDCFQLFPQILDASIDAVICDPPYNTTNFDWDQPVDWPRWWAEINRITKPEAAIVMFAAQPFATDLINSNRRNFRYELIWEKNNAVGWLSANQRPLRAHENILIFCRSLKASTYNPQKTSGHAPYKGKAGDGGGGHYSTSWKTATSNTGDRHPRSVLRYKNSMKAGDRLHPTEKPVDLLTWLVESYTNRGDSILDVFAGSFSTGEAATRCGRQFIGCERDQTYFDAGRQRMERLH